MAKSTKLSRAITRAVDFFYFPFVRRIFDLKTFRYAMVGGVNLVFGICLYWMLFNLVIQGRETNFFGLVTISGHILAFMINFVINFFTGFWLTRSVAFTDSVVKGGMQLFRYAQIVALNISINYFGLKLFVDVLGFYPTVSYMSLQFMTIGISYLASRFYIFRS